MEGAPTSRWLCSVGASSRSAMRGRRVVVALDHQLPAQPGELPGSRDDRDLHPTLAADQVIERTQRPGRLDRDSCRFDQRAAGVRSAVLGDPPMRSGLPAGCRTRGFKPMTGARSSSQRRVGGRRLGRAVYPTGLVSSRRRHRTVLRFSRTRLLDVLHRGHSAARTPRSVGSWRDDGPLRLINPSRLATDRRQSSGRTPSRACGACRRTARGAPPHSD